MNLEQKVIDWATDKGILHQFDTEDERVHCQIKQWGKMQEEVQELEVAIHMKDTPASIDELGDVIVTAIIQANLIGVSLDECLQVAYDKIAKRKGTMVDGVFVKEGGYE